MLNRKFHFQRHHLLIGFFVLCFAGAGLDHALDILDGGWMPYRNAPPAINFYWTVLAGLDIAAAALLFIRLKSGMVLALVIMASDVLINSYAMYELHILLDGWMLQLQSIFLGILIGAIPQLWVIASQTPPKNALIYVANFFEEN